MRRRAKFSFVSVENASPYRELRELNKLPSNKGLFLSSIMSTIDKELQKVKRGVQVVYEVIEKDIELETEQMNKVECQLKKSLRKVNRIHKKTMDHRSESEGYLASKAVDSISSDITALQNTAETLEVTIEAILDKISKVDNSFPEKNRLLNEEVFNEHHYPLFYELMRVKHPQTLKKAHQQEEANTGPGARRWTSREISTKMNSYDDLSKPSNSEVAESIEDAIFHYRETRSQERQAPLTFKCDALFPPSLRKSNLPVTSTSFETITGEIS